MPKHYVTFGQVHTHRINGVTFDADCVARFEVESTQQGHERAFEMFGPKFCFEYSEEEFPHEAMHFYPRGFIDL